MSHVAPHVSQPSGCLRLLTLAFFVQVSSGQKDPKIPTCSIRSYRMITVLRSLPSLLPRGDYIQSATSVSVASHDAQARHTALAFLTPAPVRGTRTGTHSLRASASRPQDVNPGQMGVLCIDHASPMAEPNKYVDIIPLEISQHILYGDGPGSGGHMWPGQQGKSVFPQSWGQIRSSIILATSPHVLKRPGMCKLVVAKPIRAGVIQRSGSHLKCVGVFVFALFISRRLGRSLRPSLTTRQYLL